MKPESKTSLIRRWSAGYLSEVEPELRMILIDHNAEFERTLDLRGIKIPDDVNHPRDLWHVGIVDGILTNIDFTFGDLGLNIIGSVVENINFSSTRFSRVILDQTSLRKCSFSKANLVVNMNDTTSTDCDFSGALFGATRSLKEFGGRRTTFTQCDFSETQFRRVEFRASTFIDCIFEGTRFQGCDMRGATFAGKRPTSSQFNHSCLMPTLEAT